jgi:iron(III) transport system substrate-binding protein
MRASCRIAVALMVASTAATGACSGSGGDDARSLTLFSGQHEPTTRLLVAAFERRTGIDVRVRFADESTLANQIADAGSKRSADVFLAKNTPALRFLERKHLLARIPVTTRARVDPRWVSPDGDFVGVSARIGALDYNTDQLKPAQLPVSVMDLASAEWNGKIGIAPEDSDFQAIVASVLITHGQERTLDWLAGVKANAGSYVYSDNDVLADAINRGQVDVGVIDQHSWFREQAKVGAARMKSRLAFFEAQDPGYLLNISAAAVMRSSHAAAAAQKFVAFLVSRAGAEIIARSQSYEYPLGSKVKPAKTLRDFNALQPVSESFDDLGFETRVIGLLQEVGLL